MHFQRFKYFLTVVSEGSISRAAANLYLSQSTLSAAILALEKSIGAPLFVRGRHGMELTTAGRALLEPAREAVRNFERSLDAVRRAVNGTTSLRVGCVVGPPQISPLPVIRRMKKLYPRHRFDCANYGSVDLSALVADGSLDIAVMYSGGAPPPNVDVQPLLTCRLALYCRPDHPLAGRFDVSGDEVARHEIVHLLAGAPVTELFRSFAPACFSDKRPHYEATSLLDALAAVQYDGALTYGPDCLDAIHAYGLSSPTLAKDLTVGYDLAMRREMMREPVYMDFAASIHAAVAAARNDSDLARNGLPARFPVA